jgi:PAS domain S-box-containing protein
MKDENKIIILTLLFGILFGMSDAVLDYFILEPDEGKTFWESALFDMGSHDLLHRASVLLLFLASGVIVSRFLSDRGRTEEIQMALHKLLELSLEDLALQEILERAIDQIVSIPWIVFQSRGAIFLVEDDSGAIVMKAQRGLNEALLATCEKLPPGRCICGKAASAKEIVFVDRVNELHENTYDGIKPHGHYCIPIQSGGELLGILNLYVKEGHKEDKKEKEFLVSIANTLAGIIKRKKIDEARRESEEKYSTLVEKGNDAIVILQDDVFKFVNSKMLELIKLTFEDVIEKPFIDYVSPDYRELVKERYKKRMAGEEVPRKYEIDVLDSDGKTVPVEINASIIEFQGMPADMAILRDITERKKTEEELRIKESAIASSINAIAIADLDGNITYVNESLVKMWGYDSDEEILGRSALEFWQSEKDPIAVIETLKTDGSWSGEMVAKRKDRSAFDAFLTANMVTNAHGAPICMMGSFLDITERKKAQDALQEYYEKLEEHVEERTKDLKNEIKERKKTEEELLESEALLKISQQIASMGGWSLDMEKDELKWSDEVYRIFGLRPQEFDATYEAFLEAIHPDDRELVDKAYADAVKNKTPYEITHRALRPDGEVRIVHEKSIEIADETGKVVRSFGMVHDITEQKRVEGDLSKFYLGLERSGEVVFITDVEGSITYVNPAFEKVYGYSKKEVIGKTPRILKSDLHSKEFYEKFWDKLVSKETVKQEIINKTKDGRLITVEAHANPILDKDKNIIGFLAIQRDVTERKRIEEELKRELDVNSAFARLSEAMIASPSIDDIADIVLDSAKKLTGSEHGYVGSIDPESRDLVTHTLTRMMGDECKIKGKDKKIKFPIGPNGKYSGLWGHTLNTRKPFYTNSPRTHKKSKGVPKGHVPLKKFLTVPALIDEKLVGQICLANSKRDYTDRDLETILRLGGLYAVALQRGRDEGRIKDSLKEKEVLLQEIHHRVKNNLQVISSLLYLQSRSTKDKELVAMLNESQGRVKTMSLIHEKLYQSEDLAQIDFGEYLSDLVDALVKSYKMNAGRIRINKDIQKVSLGIDAAIPCGLMINELISNSLQHGFPGDKSGRITVSIRPIGEDEIEIIVSDDGVGLPEYVDPTKAKTLGLKLVRRFAEKLKGTLEVDRSDGAEFRIRFLNQ